MFKNLIHFLLIGLAGLFVAACGGGGGSSSAPAVPAVPAAISAQPLSASAVLGTGVTFAVTATGDGLAYQWQLSTDGAVTWANVIGATLASYTVAAVDASMNGYQYRVVVTGETGSVISSAVTLTATAAPTAPAITAQPVPETVVAGLTATFSITATGTSLSYQWQMSTDGITWANVAGATDATLTTGTLAIADSGESYRAVVSNSVGSVTSAATLLTVTAVSGAPVISTQPTSESVVASQTATFTVTATGDPAPTYQWQRSTDAGATFADIVSASAASYSTPATATTDDGQIFRVRVSNSVSSIFSANALLSVAASGAAPVISVQPADETVFTPFTGTFAVYASGSPTPGYQWQLSVDGGSTFANINGATSASYTTPTTAAADAGSAAQYRAVVSNSVGSAVSHPATMNVVDSGMGGWIFGVALDPAGNLYASISPSGTSTSLPDSRATFYGVKKLATNGVVSVLAGSATEGHLDGTGSAATFYSPFGIAADAGGNVYVADWGVNAIRKVSPAGVVTTLAGGDIQGGFVNGVGTQASFNQPYSVAVDGGGNVYVADHSNNAIRKITPAGLVTTLAGGTAGTADGTGAAASFYSPMGVACDGAGNVYMTDSLSVRSITPSGVVTTLATSTTPGMFTGTSGIMRFDGVGADGVGNVYVYVEDGNQGAVIRKIAGGIVSTVAGSVGLGAESYSFAVDAAGNIFVGDTNPYSPLRTARPYQIREISAAGAVTYLP